MRHQKSSISLHFEKRKNVSVGLVKHTERKPNQKHSNENIKHERTEDNIFLQKIDMSYNERVDRIIKNGYKGKRTIRKDAIKVVTTTVQIGGELTRANEHEQIEVLKQAYEQLKDMYGENNIITAVIHLDETTPHLHLDFVPLIDGRLSAKDVIGDRNTLKQTHELFMNRMIERTGVGFERLEDNRLNGLKQVEFTKVMNVLADSQARREDMYLHNKKLNSREKNVLALEKQVEREVVKAKEDVDAYVQKQLNALNAKKTTIEDDLRHRKGEIAKLEENVVNRLKMANNTIEEYETKKNDLDLRKMYLDNRERRLNRREKEVDEKITHYNTLKTQIEGFIRDFRDEWGEKVIDHAKTWYTAYKRRNKEKEWEVRTKEKFETLYPQLSDEDMQAFMIDYDMTMQNGINR